MVPTHAAPISAAVQLNAPDTICRPWRPGCPIRFSGGHADLVEMHPRGHHAAVADLSYTSTTVIPAASPGTAITASDWSAGAWGSVRQTTV